MIYYIGNFAREAQRYNLFQTPAAANKMAYILECIKTFSQCTLVSLAVYKNHQWKFNKTKKSKYDPKETNVIMPSIGSPLRILRGINSLLVPLFSFFYVLFHVKKNDTIILYHSLVYTRGIAFCKRVIKFRLILEVEEIYSDVLEDRKLLRKEMTLFKAADGFIFPTNILNDKINTRKKPSVIIHGTYHVEDRLQYKLFNDEKKHVVYAGTFDPRKGGAVAAVTAAAFLTPEYHIHIIGFGNDADKNKLIEEIKRVSKLGGATVSIDGLLVGNEYVSFLQSCDIGLSTQNPDAAFNETSFPSKILSYMANGLRVVSVRIPAIEQSSVAKYLYYYDIQTPENIAKAILSVDTQDSYESRTIISNLSEQFIEHLKLLLNEKKE